MESTPSSTAGCSSSKENTILLLNLSNFRDDLEKRFDSFFKDKLGEGGSVWPHLNFKPNHLADSGFYFLGIEDKTMCAFCYSIQGNWKESDDPWDTCRHKRNCSHLKSPPHIGISNKEQLTEQEFASLTNKIDALGMDQGANRIRTFIDNYGREDWPHWPHSYTTKNGPTVRNLAQAGFHYLPLDKGEDYTSCAFCYSVIYNWEEHDDPKDPSNHAGNCPMVKKQDDETRKSTDYSIFYSEASRLQSYKINEYEDNDWPHGEIFSIQCARAGLFFFGFKDYTRCPHCCSTFYDWKPGVDPFDVHKETSPNCTYFNINGVTKLPFEKEKLMLSDDEKSTFQKFINNVFYTNGATYKPKKPHKNSIKITSENELQVCQRKENGSSEVKKTVPINKDLILPMSKDKVKLIASFMNDMKIDTETKEFIAAGTKRRREEENQEASTAAFIDNLFDTELADDEWQEFFQIMDVGNISSKGTEAQCNICKAILYSQYKLKSHMKFVHGIGNTIDSIPCDFEGCGKRFPCKSAMERHLKSHSRGKTVICPICKKGFKEIYTMTEHAGQKHGQCVWNDCNMINPEGSIC